MFFYVDNQQRGVAYGIERLRLAQSSPIKMVESAGTDLYTLLVTVWDHVRRTQRDVKPPIQPRSMCTSDVKTVRLVCCEKQTGMKQ